MATATSLDTTMNDTAELLDQLKIERSNDAPSPRRRGPLILLVASLLLVVAAAVWVVDWWRHDRLPMVTVESVRSQPTQGAASVLDASGYVTARRMATVSSKVTGKVTQVSVEEGMTVTEGQILARLDAASVSAELALSEAQLDAARRNIDEIQVQFNQAERDLERTRELNQRGLASTAELDAARAGAESLAARLNARKQDVTVAERVVALQQQRLDDSIIRAPFTGVVIAKAAQPGEMISPVSAGGGFTRTGICTIVDMDSLEIEVDVNEAYIQRVQARQSVTATLDAYPQWQIPAHVIAIVPTADRQRATVRVRIAFEQLDSRILPDMGVKVAFHNEADHNQAPQQQPRGVMVSPSAIQRDGSGESVFVLRDNQVIKTAVTSAGRLSGKVIIVSGLDAGDRIVREIPDNLSSGDTVRIANDR